MRFPTARSRPLQRVVDGELWLSLRCYRTPTHLYIYIYIYIHLYNYVYTCIYTQTKREIEIAIAVALSIAMQAQQAASAKMLTTHDELAKSLEEKVNLSQQQVLRVPYISTIIDKYYQVLTKYCQVLIKY